MKALAITWNPHPDVITVLGGSKRWLSQFIFLIEAFGFDKLYLIGKPGILHGYSIQHIEVESISEVMQEESEAKLITLVGTITEEMNVKTLKSYDHPAGDTVYYIGGDYSDVDIAACQSLNADFLTIDNAVDHHNLWSHTVAAIVVRDEYNKRTE